MEQSYLQELAFYLARRSGVRRLIQVGASSSESFEIVDSPFAEHICIDRPDMMNFVEKNAPSSKFVACDFDRSLTEQISADIFSNSVVVCSGILGNLENPHRVIRELASLRSKCPWLLLTTPDSTRMRGLLEPSTKRVQTFEWTAHSFGQLLVDCGFSRNQLIGYTVNNLSDRAKNIVLVVAGYQAEAVENSSRLKIAAIINTFNEGDIIETVVRHLVNQGVEVHLIDNWSNDGTYELGKSLLAEGVCSSLLRFPDIPTDEFQWAHQLDHAAKYANSLDADWIVHHDADEIRLSPWPGLSLAQGIEYVDSIGYSAIDFTVINFLYTDEEGASKFKPAEFKWFDWGRQPADFVQVKAWKNISRVNLTASGGHEAQFDGRRIYPIKFLTKHYPLRSNHQANRKIFRDRLPRSENERRERGWHFHYDFFRMVNEIRHWRPFELLNFDQYIFNAEYLVERISGVGVEREPKIILNFETTMAEMERLSDEVNDARNQLTDARNQLTDARNQLTDARNQLTDARNQLSDMRNQIQMIYRSSSWRLTLPLRCFAEKFPWLTHQMKRVVKLSFETLTFKLGSRVRNRIRRSQNAALIASSNFFDRDWYVVQYPDVLDAGVDPVLHYLEHGASEGRDPGPLFDTNWYLGQNPDVRAGMNPLVHYLRYGAAKGRKPSPLATQDRNLVRRKTVF